MPMRFMFHPTYVYGHDSARSAAAKTSKSFQSGGSPQKVRLENPHGAKLTRFVVSAGIKSFLSL